MLGRMARVSLVVVCCSGICRTSLQRMQVSGKLVLSRACSPAGLLGRLGTGILRCLEAGIHMVRLCSRRADGEHTLTSPWSLSLTYK